MNNKIFKTILFFSIMSMIFVGGNVFAANVCGTANNIIYSGTATTWSPYTQCSIGSPSTTVFPSAGSSVYWSCSYYQDLADNQEYDPATNTWTIKSSMNVARRGFGTAVVNGKIYIMGGSSGASTSVSSIEEYDPATNTWTDKGSMPQKNMGTFSTAVVNNKIYVMGGNSSTVGPDGNTILNTNYEYDPATNTWTTKAPMPQDSHGHSATVYNNIIYVAGGFNMTSGYLNRTIAYDPATNTWTTKAVMPYRVSNNALFTVGNKIYSVGGFSNVSGTWQDINNVQEYDPATNTWTAKTSMSYARSGLFGAVINNKIYVTGGHYTGTASPAFNSLKTEEYDPATNTWTTKANSLIARNANGTCSVAAVNNKMYVIGGYGSDVCFASREVINGSCGTANGHGYYSIDDITASEKCSSGTFTSFVDNGSSWGWGCNGLDDGINVECSANKVAVGTANETTLKDQPSINLCQYGNVVGPILSLSNDIWYWVCTDNPGLDASGYAYKTTCGADNGQTLPATPTNLCKYGDPSNVSGTGPWTWTCEGDDSLLVSCSANKTADLSCGTANGHGYYSIDDITASEKCSSGTFTSFVDNGSSWGWGCNGLDDGINVECSANKVAVGTANETTLKDQPSINLCQYGNVVGPILSLSNDIWYWVCTDNPGLDASGYAYKTTCGADNGQTLPATPTNLCKYGDPSNVSGTGPWTWTCEGDDSLLVSCSANKTAEVTSGSCGTDNGKFLTDTPVNLCNDGNPLPVSGTGPWTWTCEGINGGLDDYCSAQKITFNNPLSINSDESCWYCEYYYDLSGALRPGKVVDGKAVLDLSFSLTSSAYNSYKIGIGTNSSTPSMETIDWLPLLETSATFSGVMVSKSGTDQKNGNNGFYITYGNGTSEKTYYWFLKLTGEETWRLAGSFNTPKKPFPLVRIAADKQVVTINTNIQYCTTLPSLDATTDPCYPVCWKGTGSASLTSDDWKCSVCYNDSGSPALCTTENDQNAFFWTLPMDKGVYINSTYSTPNPIFKYTSLIGDKNPGLAITGSECAAEGETGTTVPLPTWRETN
ncbi:MAG: kelch repeat-containing protein [Candidatus Pacebacteria bacterium]|nr:kelch repeat-containing protein [Candidatus Paceibacterota bacterium]